MHINLIGVPLTYGCGKKGADKGPLALRMEDILNLAKLSGLDVFDLGDIYVPKISIGDKYRNHGKLKYLNHIVQVNKNLAEVVNLSMNSNNFPIILGGDHSLSIGSIAGVSAHYDDINDFAVIWIDAHTDMNTTESSPSGNIHGMPLAISMNEGHKSLTDLYYKGQKVKPDNVYIIGARDIDPGEYKTAKKLGVNLYKMKYIRKKGLIKTIDKILYSLNKSNIKNVHLSFDIDSMDSSLVPGTGTPVDNGFSLEEGKFILSTFLKQNIVKSIDFVELNPTLDSSDLTIETCMTLLDTIFTNINN